MDKVTVRAEQRVEDWAAGEVREVDRTRRIDTLISAGHLSVVEGVVAGTDPAVVPDRDGQEGIAVVEQGQRPTPARRGRPARPSGEQPAQPDESPTPPDTQE